MYIFASIISVLFGTRLNVRVNEWNKVVYRVIFLSEINLSIDSSMRVIQIVLENNSKRTENSYGYKS